MTLLVEWWQICRRLAQIWQRRFVSRRTPRSVRLNYTHTTKLNFCSTTQTGCATGFRLTNLSLNSAVMSQSLCIVPCSRSLNRFILFSFQSETGLMTTKLLIDARISAALNNITSTSNLSGPKFELTFSVERVGVLSNSLGWKIVFSFLLWSSLRQDPSPS